MNKFYYFAYGSNMLGERLQARCPSAVFVGPAYVCGYELQFSKRSKDCSGKATIVESREAREKLYGALFQIDKSELLPSDKSELCKLDDAEGPGYERRDDFVVVKVENGQEEEVEVITYFAKSGATGQHLKPYGWYKQLVLWGAIQAELPASYLAKLVAFDAERDPDKIRQEKELALLKEIANCVFSKETWKMKIAGNFTVADWNAMKSVLESDQSSKEIWKLAFETFFRTRIETRYFVPIRLLQKHLENQGEGFSIVALQCSLIEFLASTRKGVVFAESDTKNCTTEGCMDKIINDSPHSSAGLFKNFVIDKDLFNTGFSKSKLKDVAKRFYDDVRCALLHDARTKGKWKIRAESDDGETIKWTDKFGEKILYRDNLQKAFEQYINEYGEELTNCENLQKAFISKFDCLCKE